MEQSCRAERQSAEKPVVRVRRVRAASRLRSPSVSSSNKAKEESATPSQDSEFWIDCQAENLKVFNNPKDRRIVSIARASGCQLKLTETRRKNALGQWQQLVIIQPTTETGIQKCINLLDEKFPEFQSGFKPRYKCVHSLCLNPEPNEKRGNFSSNECLHMTAMQARRLDVAVCSESSGRLSSEKIYRGNASSAL
ncbi:unnamed protein product [Dibothriocephalus latus]|uniref:Uncharacterized protein n=1 Tax=Dibothriocephalus latus TaxID=60516 RepID=A0A3P7LJX9_DIBLA|nr:unnamed protein product [Dibothriocephalus latus]